MKLKHQNQEEAVYRKFIGDKKLNYIKKNCFNKNLSKKKMIILCASEAGPAEYISCIAIGLKEPFLCISSEISRKIFDKYGIKNINFDPKILTNRVNLILCGSSLNNQDPEFKLFHWALKMSIESILVIEHWTNFDIRMQYFKKNRLPNQIWVNDIWSKNKFKTMDIPDHIIKVVGNPYLEKIELNKTESNYNFNKIIFISEEMKSKDIDLEPVYGFNEFDVLEFIVKNKPENLKLYIKHHPSESKKKYDYLIRMNDVELYKDKKKICLFQHVILE